MCCIARYLMNKNSIVCVCMLFACIVLQGLDDVYNSTLHILDDNKLIHSVVGSRNVFQLQKNKLRENQQYKAYVQLTFHYVCSFVDVNTSIFYLSESYCVLVAQVPTQHKYCACLEQLLQEMLKKARQQQQHNRKAKHTTQHNRKAKQYNTTRLKQSFSKKNWLSQVGLETTTISFPGNALTN